MRSFFVDAEEVTHNVEVPIVSELEIPRKTVNLQVQACLNFTKVESETIDGTYLIEEKKNMVGLSGVS